MIKPQIRRLVVAVRALMHQIESDEDLRLAISGTLDETKDALMFFESQWHLYKNVVDQKLTVYGWSNVPFEPARSTARSAWLVVQEAESGVTTSRFFHLKQPASYEEILELRLGDTIGFDYRVWKFDETVDSKARWEQILFWREPE